MLEGFNDLMSLGMREGERRHSAPCGAPDPAAGGWPFSDQSMHQTAAADLCGVHPLTARFTETDTVAGMALAQMGHNPLTAILLRRLGG